MSKKMAEYSRSKEFKKKTDFQVNKDQRRGAAVILTKHDKDSGHSRDHGMKRSASTPSKEEKQQPTILIKTREGERAVSPNSKSSSTTTLKKDEPVQPTYQLQSKPSTNESLAPAEMVSPVKLLDLETLTVVDSCLEYLSDQNDFLVVGIAGYQGVGKSTIVSLLADPDCVLESKCLFQVQKQSDLEVGQHRTDGINMYITKNRIIFLDTQPIMSASVHIKLLQQQDSVSGKKFQHPDYPYECSDVEIQSLQLLAFLYSVCHVVVFVQHFWFDPDALRYLQTAEMLKPSTPTSVDEAMVEYFPQLIFVQNKCRPSDFEPRKVKQMQEVYYKTFQHSRLQIQTGFGIANGEVNPVLNQESCGELINLFLLPEIDAEPLPYIGHSGFSDLICQFRRQIISTPRTPLTHSTLTEKNWFHYAFKTWDGIKKSTFFNEYHRLLNA